MQVFHAKRKCFTGTCDGYTCTVVCTIHIVSYIIKIHTLTIIAVSACFPINEKLSGRIIFLLTSYFLRLANTYYYLAKIVKLFVR